MKKVVIALLGFIFFSVLACQKRDDDSNRVQIPNFNFPKTVVFEQNLSTYGIFQGNPTNLTPSTNFHLLELSSVLFTDYAHKQRLVKVPAGTKMTKQNNGSIDFPDGTTLVKTFFYYKDERDTSLGKRVIETRLLIKENNIWNAATYVWNETQTEASLDLNGSNTQMSWINANGKSFSTAYHIPNLNECIACHQSKSTMIPLGTTLRNLNRTVNRKNGASLNQINHLQSIEVLNDFEVSELSEIVDYTDLNASLQARARAYLVMNCAHCHNPDGWEEPAERDFDFRYETALNQTGILFEKDKIIRSLTDEEMPFIGTSIPDEEGIQLVVNYIRSL
jgi:uncharacterized repeat protein (TIGR03806 family)